VSKSSFEEIDKGADEGQSEEKKVDRLSDGRGAHDRAAEEIGVEEIEGGLDQKSEVGSELG